MVEGRLSILSHTEHSELSIAVERSVMVRCVINCINTLHRCVANYMEVVACVKKQLDIGHAGLRSSLLKLIHCNVPPK